MTTNLGRTLNNGVVMPRLGFGTYLMTGQTCKAAVLAALETGYRHIDTATIYRNEEAVGEAVHEFCTRRNISRSDIFVTSKLNPREHGTVKARAALEGTLQRLKFTYVDLYLIHWPGVQGRKTDDSTNKDIRMETWLTLQDMYKEGKARAIGVSNYTEKHLEEMLHDPRVTVFPAVNQVEFHPLCYQKQLQMYCDGKQIALEAYSPLACGKPQMMSNPIVLSIAKNHSRTAAQILLRWSLQNKTIVVGKSADPERIKSNFQILDFTLTQDDMSLLNHLGPTLKHFCWDPNTIA